jgi:hypothetical protein
MWMNIWEYECMDMNMNMDMNVYTHTHVYMYIHIWVWIWSYGDMSVFIPKGPRLESRPHRAGVAPLLLPTLGSSHEKQRTPKKQTKKQSTTHWVVYIMGGSLYIYIYIYIYIYMWWYPGPWMHLFSKPLNGGAMIRGVVPGRGAVAVASDVSDSPPRGVNGNASPQIILEYHSVWECIPPEVLRYTSVSHWESTSCAFFVVVHMFDVFSGSLAFTLQDISPGDQF